MNLFQISNGEIVEATQEQVEQAQVNIMGFINRSGFGQRMPDGRIVWSHQGDKKAKK